MTSLDSSADLWPGKVDFPGTVQKKQAATNQLHHLQHPQDINKGKVCLQPSGPVDPDKS